jgi:hypothetical protein
MQNTVVDVVDSLLSVIDVLLAFVSKHARGLLDPSALLTKDQIEELTNLDTQLYAQCQLSGLSLPVVAEPEGLNFRYFGNSRLPYFWGTIHLPIKDEAGKVTQDMVGSGMMIMPTPEWIHALRSLRVTAEALKAKTQENGKATSSSISNTEKPKRGRPHGSKTETYDLKLYLDWKAANRETGVTKKEFLHARGLPERELAAIERGRQQAKKKTAWKK